jgi:hypothetical protein
MEAMIRRQQQRLREENKQTAFELRGRPVNQEKIDRYKRDHAVKDDDEAYQTMEGAGKSLSFSSTITARY